MKTLKKSLFILVMMIGLFAVPKDAHATHIKYEHSGTAVKTMHFDLYGGSSKETIKFIGTGGDFKEWEKVTIYLIKPGDKAVIVLELDNISAKGVEIERHIYCGKKILSVKIMNGPIEYYFLYNFNSNGVPKRVANLTSGIGTNSGLWDMSIVYSSKANMEIIVRYEKAVSGVTGGGRIIFDTVWKWKDGKFVRPNSSSEILTPMIKTYQKEKFKTTKTGSKTAFTVNKNTTVKLVKVQYYNSHLYGRFYMNGKYGWRKLI